MKSTLRFIVSNKVFTVSAFTLILSSLTIFWFTESFYDVIETTSLWVRRYFGVFYLWLGLGCVLFLLGLAFSKAGKLRLGNEPPEFDRLSWIAMLYSAGMGAGILLRAVQEPVFMYLNPPIQKTGIPDNIIALEYTFYQWGFTAWAFYGIFAVIIGYAIFRDKADVRLSSAFPSIRKMYALPATVDLLTILTTVIGVVAAIGLGTTQIEGGLSYLMAKPPGSLFPNLLLVFIICFLAFLSAWAGVQKGIRRISNWNIYAAILLLFFVFIQGDISRIFASFFETLYHYILDFIPLSLAYGSFDPGLEFLTDWTFYYWAFWLAWAPFTGIFIARISRGRSLREMILGVLLIPSLGSFFWFSVFGDSAIGLIENWETYNNEFENVFTSIFVIFEAFPLSFIVSATTIALLISFLVTSVDSAIFVLSMFTDKGKQEPRRIYRLAWAVLIFIFCEAVIFLGEVKPDSNVLNAMQKFLIISSIPFAILTVLLAILFLRRIVKTTKQ